jgi:hypothetical protein
MDTGLETSAAVSARPAGRRGLRHGLELLRARRAARRARWDADTEIAACEGSPPLSLAWRVDELVGTKNRLDLAHALRSLVRDSNLRYVPSASPVNRAAARAHSDELLAIAGRLADLDHPLQARGVVLADRLLVDGAGPLYDRERVGELPSQLEEALTALRPR